MERMSIHRALAELKLIDAKIKKIIETIEPVGVFQKGKLLNNGMTNEQFHKDAKSKFQSFNALLKRKANIKSAIVLSNSKTIVNVDGSDMTVADAITKKSYIETERAFLTTLKSKHSHFLDIMEQNNNRVEQNALKIAEAALQKDNVKIGDNDAVAITEPYIEKNRFSLSDPLSVIDTVSQMEDNIDSFESHIDSILSESNAVTFIEI